MMRNSLLDKRHLSLAMTSVPQEPWFGEQEPERGSRLSTGEHIGLLHRCPAHRQNRTVGAADAQARLPVALRLATNEQQRHAGLWWADMFRKI